MSTSVYDTDKNEYTDMSLFTWLKLNREETESVSTHSDDEQVAREDSENEEEEDTDGYLTKTLFRLSNGGLRYATDIWEGNQFRSI